MSPTRPISDRVVIVTGSSRGIGRETVRGFLRDGVRVVMNGRDAAGLENTRKDILADTGVDADRLLAVAADLSTEDGSAALIRAALERFGRIDVLINNAGVSMRGAIRDLRRETVEGLIGGTSLAAIYPTVAALPALLESRGTVAFVSTAAALWGFPGVSWYSAMKAALRSFAQSLDSEYRSEGLQVTTIFLDFVENDPDKETFSADGGRFVHTRRARLSQTEAASAIRRAVDTPRRERYVSVGGRALALAARFAPRLLAYYLSRSGGSLHRVDRRD